MSHLLATTNPERAGQLQREGDAAVEAAAQAMKDGVSLDPAHGETAAEPPVEPILGPMPEVGDSVLYIPRRGERRRGRDKIPAIVSWVYPETGHCDLTVIFEANDFVQQERVARAVGEERGWMLKGQPAISAVAIHRDYQELERLRHDVADLRKIVLGEYETPMTPILDMLDAVDKRVDALVGDGRQIKPKAKPAKAKSAKKRR